MEYRYKNFRFPVKANDVGKYFEDLHNTFGEIDPKVVVEKAREESNLLHNCFEWQDDIAAEKYRIHQARQLIRCVVVVEDDKQIETRAFVNVSFSEGQPNAYHTTSVVLQNEYSRDLLLKQAKKDIDTFQTKYKSLNELSDVLNAMESFRNDS